MDSQDSCLECSKAISASSSHLADNSAAVVQKILRNIEPSAERAELEDSSMRQQVAVASKERINRLPESIRWCQALLDYVEKPLQSQRR